jgi:hypothetical protein
MCGGIATVDSVPAAIGPRHRSSRSLFLRVLVPSAGWLLCLYTGLGTPLLPSLDRVGDRPGSAGQVMNGGARLVYVRLRH